MKPTMSPEQARRWAEATAPLRSALTTLVSSYPDETRLPDAKSEEMAELAQEHAWASRHEAWGKEPVQAVHSIAGLSFRLALDCALGFELLLRTTNPPLLYSPAALLRPILEGSGRTLWLSEPNIGVKERLRRGFNERLSSLYSQKDLPDPDVRSHAIKRTKQILVAAEELGYVVSKSFRGKRRFIGDPSPSQRQVIKRLFRDYHTDPTLPAGLSLFANSISHAGTLGLTAFAETQEVNRLEGTRLAELRMEQSDAAWFQAAVLMAIIRAGSARVELRGMEASNWQAACGVALQRIGESLGEL